MALQSVELYNVRAFSQKWWSFDLAPITVLCGPNSGGKSTVLKSLITLKQNVDGGDLGGLPMIAGRLNLSGPLVDMGSYGSIVSKGQSQLSVGLGVRTSFSVSPDMLEPIGGMGRAFGGDGPDIELECRARFRFGTWNETAHTGLPSAVRSRLHGVEFVLAAGGRDFLEWKVELAENRAYRPKSRYLKTPYVLSVPRRYLEQEGGTEFIAVRGRGDSPNVRFGVVLEGLLPSMMIGRLRSEWVREHGTDGENRDRDRAIPLPPLIEAAVDSIRADLGGARYIGPLRAPAQRVYVSPVDVDSPLHENDGDYVIQSLRAAPECIVEDWRPEAGATTTDLHESLQYWLRFLRTGAYAEPSSDEVVLDLLGDSIIQPRVRSPYGRRSYAMADSGFGYSQVMPILIASLMAKPDQTVVIEQPEVHLHPALQVRLASFFVAMTEVRKRFLIETHSEHIVDALRVALAERTLDGFPGASGCTVYYVETGENWPQVTNLSIEPNGTVSDWPASFFGESRQLAQRLMRSRIELSRRDLHGGGGA